MSDRAQAYLHLIDALLNRPSGESPQILIELNWHSLLEAVKKVDITRAIAMTQVPRFEAVVESVEALSVEEQEILIDLVRRRLVERRRAEIAANIAKAQEEYQAGAVFDGKVFHPDQPIALKANTRVRITIETVPPNADETASFLQTARSLNLDGPPDWSANLDKYLYGIENQHES